MDYGADGSQEKSEGAMLFIEEPVTKNRKNKLKDGQDVPLIIATEDASSPICMHHFSVEETLVRSHLLRPLAVCQKSPCLIMIH